MDKTAISSLIAEMPKAELHLHLEGAIPVETVVTLARRNNLLRLLPGTKPEDIRHWYQFDDFYHFMDVNRVIKNLLRTADDFELAIYAIGQALARHRVLYAEITVTPYTHTHVQQKDLTIDAIFDGLDRGRQRVQQEFGIELRWIFDIPRNRAFADYKDGGAYVAGAAEYTLRYALDGRSVGVIGLGLGGSEVNAPPEAFQYVFAEAKANGLLSIPHAGEGQGPESVWGAIRALHADRIGHGVRAIEDEALIASLAESQIPLEVNVTSNIGLHIYDELSAHPLPLLDNAGVIVTINTDIPAFFGTDLSQEFELIVDVFGFGFADVIRIARNAFRASGAESEVKDRLLRAFDTWAAN